MIVTSQLSDGKWLGNYHGGTMIGYVFGTAAAVSTLAETAPWKIIVKDVIPEPSPADTNDTVSIHSSVMMRSEMTNITLITWYRASTNDPFTALGMTNDVEDTFYTTSSIPAQVVDTEVEYYLKAIYYRDDIVTTQRYPNAHPAAYMSYTVFE